MGRFLSEILAELRFPEPRMPDFVRTTEPLSQLQRSLSGEERGIFR